MLYDALTPHIIHRQKLATQILKINKHGPWIEPKDYEKFKDYIGFSIIW